MNSTGKFLMLKYLAVIILALCPARCEAQIDGRIEVEVTPHRDGIDALVLFRDFDSIPPSVLNPKLPLEAIVELHDESGRALQTWPLSDASDTMPPRADDYLDIDELKGLIGVGRRFHWPLFEKERDGSNEKEPLPAGRFGVRVGLTHRLLMEPRYFSKYWHTPEAQKVAVWSPFVWFDWAPIRNEQAPQETTALPEDCLRVRCLLLPPSPVPPNSPPNESLTLVCELRLEALAKPVTFRSFVLNYSDACIAQLLTVNPRSGVEVELFSGSTRSFRPQRDWNLTVPPGTVLLLRDSFSIPWCAADSSDRPNIRCLVFDRVIQKPPRVPLDYQILPVPTVIARCRAEYN